MLLLISKVFKYSIFELDPATRTDKRGGPFLSSWLAAWIGENKLTAHSSLKALIDLFLRKSAVPLGDVIPLATAPEDAADFEAICL